MEGLQEFPPLSHSPARGFIKPERLTAAGGVQVQRHETNDSPDQPVIQRPMGGEQGHGSGICLGRLLKLPVEFSGELEAFGSLEPWVDLDMGYGTELRSWTTKFLPQECQTIL